MLQRILLKSTQRRTDIRIYFMICKRSCVLIWASVIALCRSDIMLNVVCPIQWQYNTHQKIH